MKHSSLQETKDPYMYSLLELAAFKKGRRVLSGGNRRICQCPLSIPDSNSEETGRGSVFDTVRKGVDYFRVPWTVRRSLHASTGLLW